MRLRREEWTDLNPDDVAWITEWQLASAFCWLPLECERTVLSAPHAEPDGRHWAVTVRAGESGVRVLLPLRDLAKLVRWCHAAPSELDLMRPPAEMRAALLALRAALRRGLRELDPLGRMGYVEQGQGASGS